MKHFFSNKHIRFLFLFALLLGSCTKLFSSSDSVALSTPTSEPDTSELSSELPSSSQPLSSETPSSESSTSEPSSSEPLSSESSSQDIISSESSSVVSSSSESTNLVLWPALDIVRLFNDDSLPAYGYDGSEVITYEIDEVNRILTMTILTSEEDAFQGYIDTLDAAYYMVNINYMNASALAQNTGGLITVFFSYATGVLSFEIRGVDYAFYDAMYVTYVRHNAIAFPVQILTTVFDVTFANAVLPYITSDSFYVYTRRFVHKNTVKIEIKNSSADECGTYYFSLMDDLWTLTGTYASGTFTAFDPLSSAKLDVEFNSVTKAVTIDVTRQ